MPYVNVGAENSGRIDLYYEDHGAGTPVVLIHGYPLSGHSWEKQVPVLLAAGHRVITYDRGDLPKIDVPTLVVQGTEDRILPIDATGRRLPALIKGVTFTEIDGGPHNIGWTHPDEVNRALLTFLEE